MNRQFFRNILPGTVLFNRFRLERCLSARDSGAVYLCNDRREGGRLTALKIVLACLDDAKTSGSLFNELKLTQAVHHPNVLRADAFYADDEFRAYTMEVVSGGSLQAALARRRLGTLKERIQIIRQLCDGLHAIHKAEIIHRDIKPENILVSGGNEVKISDFGIATEARHPVAINDPCIMGTLDYLSPEYVLEGQCSVLSDIYAVGVIGYQLLTGRLPHDADSLVDLLAKKTLSDPVPPLRIFPECPKVLNDFILTAMERRPERRVHSAAELIAQLDRLPSAYKIRGAGSGSYARIVA